MGVKEGIEELIRNIIANELKLSVEIDTYGYLFIKLLHGGNEIDSDYININALVDNRMELYNED